MRAWGGGGAWEAQTAYCSDLHVSEYDSPDFFFLLNQACFDSSREVSVSPGPPWSSDPSCSILLATVSVCPSGIPRAVWMNLARIFAGSKTRTQVEARVPFFLQIFKINKL